LKSIKRVNKLLTYFFAFFFEEIKSNIFLFLLFLPIYLFNRKEIIKLKKYPKHVRLRKILESLGPTFIKLGQILSLRVDLFPEKYLEELSKLQDRGPKVDFEYLKKYLGEKIYAFEFIEPTPIGTGSIAQVHKGILKTGEKVAIKFIKPKVEEQIKTDLNILEKFLSFIEKLPFLKSLYKNLDLKKVFEEIKSSLLEEINLENELSYISLFRKSLNSEICYIPKPFWDLSNKKVLVVEFVEGEKITSFVKNSKNDLKQIEDILSKLLKVTFKQLFELGYFHADLHPGNIIITKDKKICLIDFGIIGRVSRKLRLAHGLFAYGVVTKNEEIIFYSLKLAGLITDKTNTEGLKRHILKKLDKYLARPLKRICLRDYIYEEIEAMKKYNVYFPEDLVLLLKTIVQLEGLIRYLYPDFILVSYLKPYVKNIFPKLMLEVFRYKIEEKIFENL